MGWIARLAARRVVWIIVGLVVYGLLNVAGIRAASGLATTGTWSGDAALSPSVAGVTAGDVIASSGFTVTAGSVQFFYLWGASAYTVTGSGPAMFGGPYGSNQSFGSFNAGGGAASLSTTASATAAYGVIMLRCSNGPCTIAGTPTWQIGAVTPDPTPTPTPVPTAVPTATPTPTPPPAVQVVALVAEDRARLDDMSAIGTASAALSVLLLTAVLVVTGLRR